MPVNFRGKTAFMAGVTIDENFVAGADLSSAQYYFVMPGSILNEVKLCTCVADPFPLGVLQNAPTVCQIARVRVFGRTTMAGSPNVSGCNLVYGRWITSGCLGAAATPAAGTCPVFGRWLSATVTNGNTTACGEAFVNCFAPGACAAGLGSYT